MTCCTEDHAYVTLMLSLTLKNAISKYVTHSDKPIQVMPMTHLVTRNWYQILVLKVE